jgi:cell division septum initiation protein DivIVA
VEEQKEWEDEVIAAEGRVAEFEEKLRKSESEKDGLQNKMEMLEEQIKELKGEEVDFKRTIGAAQRFVDELKASSEKEASELIQSSEEKASAALQAARDEIERLRQDAFTELSRLPEEIAQLNHQKRQVQGDLRETLHAYLEQIESFSDADETVKEYEFDELFQKIELSDDSAEESDEEGSAQTAPDEQPEDGEALDLELPLDNEEDDDEDEQKDDLRKKLEEGGIAYLSDDS